MTIFKFKSEIKNVKVNLNDICLELCLYILNGQNDLIKYFLHNDILEWEYRVYLKILKLSVLATYDNYRLIYHTSDKIPLVYLIDTENFNTENFNTVLILNELFSFVNSFKELNFIHGNLHVNNIYMDTNNTNKCKYKFYIIDFSSSYIQLNFNKIANYKRESFLRENEKKKEKFLNYWDHYTLYVSLNEFLNDKCKKYLGCLILNYIPKDKLNILKQEFLIK